MYILKIKSVPQKSSLAYVAATYATWNQSLNSQSHGPAAGQALCAVIAAAAALGGPQGPGKAAGGCPGSGPSLLCHLEQLPCARVHLTVAQMYVCAPLDIPIDVKVRENFLE